MKYTNVTEIEIQRNNVTPAQFLSYVRRSVDKKGAHLLRSYLDLAYFAAGDDLNFDVRHGIDDERHELDGVREVSVSKPYRMQTFIAGPSGKYNEICEFEFWDEKTGYGYYYLYNADVEPEEEEQEDAEAAEAAPQSPEERAQAIGLQIIDEARQAIEERKERSAWGRGLKVYASELLDGLEDGISGGYIDAGDLRARPMVEKAMLDGADDWSAYSLGGSALCYDGDIAERLCSPSELKKTRNGERRPNSRENWLDVQARALYQAARRVKIAIADAAKHHAAELEALQQEPETDEKEAA